MLGWRRSGRSLPKPKPRSLEDLQSKGVKLELGLGTLQALTCIGVNQDKRQAQRRFQQANQQLFESRAKRIGLEGAVTPKEEEDDMAGQSVSIDSPTNTGMSALGTAAVIGATTLALAVGGLGAAWLLQRPVAAAATTTPDKPVADKPTPPTTLNPGGVKIEVSDHPKDEQ